MKIFRFASWIHLAIIVWLASPVTPVLANDISPSFISGSDWSRPFFLTVARAITPDNDPKNLTTQINFEKNIFRLDQIPRSMEQALSKRPWADRRWPMLHAMLGSRYSDSGFLEVAENSGFEGANSYINNFSIRRAVRASVTNPGAIDLLSPSEKYDLLVGDLDGTLTKSLWLEAKRLSLEKGIKNWMGLCEGSAAAAVTENEPVNKIVVKSAFNGIPVTFNAVDIKGLLALSWSSYGIDIPIIGNRCDLKKPDVSNAACWDTNPAAWHIAVLNLVGDRRGHLMIDRDPGVEVWNVPVLNYKFEYIHPITGAVINRIQDAMTDISKMPNIQGLRRTPGTKYIVGVKMSVIGGNRVNNLVPNNGSTPLVRSTFNYIYDLELAANGNILGGEWRGKTDRPDFIWAIGEKVKPAAKGDKLVSGQWQINQALPLRWQNAAIDSSKSLQVMRVILDRLVALSADY
jgi:hypothetical protein